ncbi:MAG: hypothetical protein KDD62_08315 [Bdellovibrionales bacterium]|nr:hypothetical protein [Bdellovibrionales bacterium]
MKQSKYKSHFNPESGYDRQFAVILKRLARTSGLLARDQSLIYLCTDHNNLSLIHHEDESLTLEVGMHSKHSAAFSEFGGEHWVVLYRRGEVQLSRNGSSHHETVAHPEFHSSIKKILRMCAMWYSLFKVS